MKILRPTLSALALCLVIGFLVYKTADLVGREMVPAGGNRQTAPEFPQGLEWLNTGGPLRLSDLGGKIVLLDFWTYCCINCMHVIPDLKKLEVKYPDELVVIGVHSAKFTTEQETENIREAVMRHELSHPVVNDKDMRIWDLYDVHAWPTLVLIDPAGEIVGSLSGEGVYEPLGELIGQIAADFDKRGLLDKKPITWSLEKDKTVGAHSPNEGPLRGRAPLLSFPGKVLADEGSKRLFIADSNHNRVLVASLEGEVRQIIGSGQISFADGDFNTAAFNHPQGMALEGDKLYIADTENHAIRAVDLKRKSVETVAGTGRQAGSFHSGGAAKSVDLNSPWDLLVHEGTLYIAMAGFHQVWKMDLKSGQIHPYAGSGREALIDGSLKQAALAQPSGITTDGKKLYFADSETSSIRSVDLDPEGKVETLVGLDLFEFGDRDGTGNEVRLQHPLGVAYHDGVLYVADTYNDKIKVLDPQTKKISTFLAGVFNEPGGLTVADGKLYIADTNNHAIRAADLNTKKISLLELKGLPLPPAPVAEKKRGGETVILPEQSVGAGAAKLILSVALPEGYKMNEQAPSRVKLTAGGKTETIQQPEFPLTVPVNVAEGEQKLTADMVLYYCDEKTGGLCYFKEVGLEIPVRGLSGGALNEIKGSYTIKQISGK